MLNEKVLAKLNEQIGLEFESSNLYLQMSAWCSSNGIDGCAAFLREHAQEEMGHMMRLFDYVLETGAMSVIPALPKPRSEFESVGDVFGATYEHEKFITRKINELVATAFSEQDFSTFNFLQWYVAEQHEEEALFKSVLDMIEMVGIEGRGLFFIDREISALRDRQNAGGATATEGAEG